MCSSQLVTLACSSKKDLIFYASCNDNQSQLRLYAPDSLEDDHVIALIVQFDIVNLFNGSSVNYCVNLIWLLKCPQPHGSM